MAFVVQTALSLRLRQTPTMLSMYESIQSCLGMWRQTSADNASWKAVDSGSMDGDGMEDGSGMGSCVIVGDHVGLFAMSFERSVINSMIIHHSAGLLVPLNVRRRYMYAHTAVVRMHVIAEYVFKWRRRYAASKSNLHVRMLWQDVCISWHGSCESNV